MVKVWLYSIASLFSLVVLVAARHAMGRSHLEFMGESLGLVIVLLSCQICFHLNGVDELLADSKPQAFIRKTLKSAGAGLLTAGPSEIGAPPLQSAALMAVEPVRIGVAVATAVLVSTPLHRPWTYIRDVVGADAYHPSTAALGADSYAYRESPSARTMWLRNSCTIALA